MPDASGHFKIKMGSSFRWNDGEGE